MLRVVATLLVIGLVVYALVDLAGAEEDELRGLPKWLWVILIIFLPLGGALAWIVMRASSRGRRVAPRPAGAPPARQAPPRRTDAPVAPDDDPEFLWLLEQSRRKREREAGPAAGTGADDDPTDGNDDPTDAPNDPDDGKPRTG
ncbi:PLD nuclease N-terminal domain-containing protein [Antribacter gilvus]|uniref:PLD nuclease N-terminal domain-containing protein n=1 Tax=Antribacter gilvus TaxID=2304675 RepID=UPI000F7AD63B|nr:PLD nuclease N-terminal domain-containing protein [Antribacter gilvus]